MNKKVLLMSIILAIVLVVTIVIFTLKPHNKPKSNNGSNEVFDSKVVSKFTMDVNPSLEISLNKDNVVIEVRPINGDSKKYCRNY